MIVQYYRKIKGKVQHVECECELQLEQIEQFIINPPNPISDSKDDQYLIYWGERLDDSVSRIAENWGKRWAIVLDYDGSLVDEEVKFDDFYTKYNTKFEFYMHSSWNHIIKGFDKFRVIIPVQKPYMINRDLKVVLTRIFVGLDRSSFDNRGFYIPVKRDNYRFAISRGKILDISCFDKLVNKEREADAERKREKERKKEAYKLIHGDSDDTKQHRVNILNKITKDLSAINWKSDGIGRYNKLRDTIYYLKTNSEFYFEDYEIEDLLKDYISYLSTINQRSLYKLIEKN